MPEQIGNLNLFTLDEIHERLGITVPTLRKYIEAGDLKARKIGRKGWVVTENALQEFFESGNKKTLNGESATD